MSLLHQRVRSSSLDSSQPFPHNTFHDSGDISYTTNSLLDNGVVEPLASHPLRRACAFNDIAGSDPHSQIHAHDVQLNIWCPQQNLAMQIVVNSRLTVLKLKHQIMSFWNNMDGSMSLVCNGSTLSDHSIIQELGIAHGDTVQVTLPLQLLSVNWQQPIKRKSEDEITLSNKKTLVDR